MQLPSLLFFSTLCFCVEVIGQAAFLPCDPKATRETKNLLVNLHKLRLKGTMFGHQDALDYGIGWKEKDNDSDVLRVVGDYPAVFGWELGNLELGRTHDLDSVSFDRMIKYIQQVYELGGINTISWHAYNPVSGKTAWDTTGNHVVGTILPGGANHNKYNDWLNHLAVFFKSLKTKQGTQIPILFRPFHELSGSWFWWGKNHCTPQEYQRLWKYTIDYFRNTQQIHHLLYVYSTDVIKSHSEYMERYPGDGYVDVVGIDIYHREDEAGVPKFIEHLKTGLGAVAQTAKEHGKLPVFSETGLEQIPIANWWTEILWKNIKPFQVSYVLVWRNAVNRPNHYYAPYPGQISVNNFKEFEKLPEVLFRKDLTRVYQ